MPLRRLYYVAFMLLSLIRSASSAPPVYFVASGQVTQLCSTASVSYQFDTSSATWTFSHQAVSINGSFGPTSAQITYTSTLDIQNQTSNQCGQGGPGNQEQSTISVYVPGPPGTNFHLAFELTGTADASVSPTSTSYGTIYAVSQWASAQAGLPGTSVHNPFHVGNSLNGTTQAATVLYQGQTYSLATVIGGQQLLEQVYLISGDFGAFTGHANVTISAQISAVCQLNAPCITSPSDGASPQSQFVALSGTGTAGDTLNVLINGLPVGQVQVDAEGKWEALPYVASFGSSVTVQVEDQFTFNSSNTITVHPVMTGLPPGPAISFSRLLPLRHADILVSSNPSSLEVPLIWSNVDT